MHQASTIERLYAAHNARITHKLTCCYHDDWQRDLVDDAMSSAWLILERKLRQDPGYLRSEHEAAGWLFVVARRQLTRITRKTRQLVSSADPDDMLAEFQSPWSTEQLADDQRDLAGILELLHGEQLTSGQQQMLTARMIGLDYKQAAAATGSTYTRVARHVTEGRRAARELLS